MYPFEKGLEVWHGKACHTTTASSTCTEVRELTRSAPAAAAAASGYHAVQGIMDQRQPMLQQMPVGQAMQLMLWQQ